MVIKKANPDSMSLFFNLPTKNKSRVRTFSYVWRMARRCYFGLWHPLALASTNHEAIGRLPEEIPQSPFGTSGGAGNNNKSFSEDEQRIKECERRYVENKRKIQQLKSELSSRVEEKFRKGVVDSLPMLAGHTNVLPVGVSLKLLHYDREFDIVLIEGEKGCKINSHRHKQEQYIKVLDGKIRVKCGAKKVSLHRNNDVLIFPGQMHSIEFKGKTKILSIHRPPLSFNPLEEK